MTIDPSIDCVYEDTGTNVGGSLIKGFNARPPSDIRVLTILGTIVYPLGGMAAMYVLLWKHRVDIEERDTRR